MDQLVVVVVSSGGRTLAFVPFAAVHVLEDKEQQARCVGAMKAFNAPYSMMLLELDAAHMYDTAAENMGKVFVSSEIGGGESASATSARIAKRGIANVLKHAGILSGVVLATLVIHSSSLPLETDFEHDNTPRSASL